MDQAARKPRRWPLVVAVGAAATVLAAGTTAALMLAGDGRTAPASTPTASTASTSSEGVANGCSAGASITNASLLESQQRSALNDVGAASFAADIFRWLGTDPTAETADDLEATINRLLATDASDQVRTTFTYAVAQAREGQSTDDWIVSTLNAQYYVESAAPDRTVVSVTASRVFDDGTSQNGAQTFTLAPGEAGWSLQDMSQLRTVADLQAIGTYYAGGC